MTDKKADLLEQIEALYNDAKYASYEEKHEIHEQIEALVQEFADTVADVRTSFDNA